MHFVSWRKRALPSPPTPMMSSKTTFPHRIGGSRHKFPENSQPISPTITNTTSQHRPVSHFLPEESPLLRLFFPPRQRQPQKPLPAFLSSRLFSIGRKTIGSRSWRWWRRKSKPCSNKLMKQRSVSWGYKGSWTRSWNCAKKWEKSHYSRSTLFGGKNKIKTNVYCQHFWIREIISAHLCCGVTVKNVRREVISFYSFARVWSWFEVYRELAGTLLSWLSFGFVI